MALSNTTLASACAIGDTQIVVTSATGFPAVGASARSQQVQVDGEFMWTIDGIAQPSTGLIKVRSRGSNGGVARAHGILAPVKTSATGSDWNDPAPGTAEQLAPFRPAQTNVGENGIIPVPTMDTEILLTKATALASTTLGAPSVASNGIEVTITSTTAAAHVITATTLLADAVSGSPHTTATFAAFIGATLTLVAVNGLWNVKASVGVTIT